MPSVSILDMFAASPVKPLQSHMKSTLTAVDRLAVFFSAVLLQDWQAANTDYQVICEAELKADQLKADLREHLPKGLFMSMSRTDILGMLKTQEKIANACKEIATLVLTRKMIVPEEIQESTKLYIDHTVHAVHRAASAVSRVDELMEIGFKGIEADKIERRIHQIDDQATIVEDLHLELRQALFLKEDALSPVDVMFLYRVFEKIATIAVLADSLGGRLLLLLAK